METEEIVNINALFPSLCKKIYFKRHSVEYDFYKWLYKFTNENSVKDFIATETIGFNLKESKEAYKLFYEIALRLKTIGICTSEKKIYEFFESGDKSEKEALADILLCSNTIQKSLYLSNPQDACEMSLDDNIQENK